MKIAYKIINSRNEKVISHISIFRGMRTHIVAYGENAFISYETLVLRVVISKISFLFMIAIFNSPSAC